jgi:hypothetical protein
VRLHTTGGAENKRTAARGRLQEAGRALQAADSRQQTASVCFAFGSALKTEAVSSCESRWTLIGQYGITASFNRQAVSSLPCVLHDLMFPDFCRFASAEPKWVPRPALGSTPHVDMTQRTSVAHATVTFLGRQNAGTCEPTVLTPSQFFWEILSYGKLN